MTSERKAEVNRRLAGFEFPGGIEDMPWLKNKTNLYRNYSPSDYTADLNALARLEAKLPIHFWESHIYGDKVLWEIWQHDDCIFLGAGEELTEAEARAEAICQYLTRVADGDLRPD